MFSFYTNDWSFAYSIDYLGTGICHNRFRSICVPCNQCVIINIMSKTSLISPVPKIYSSTSIYKWFAMQMSFDTYWNACEWSCWCLQLHLFVLSVRSMSPDWFDFFLFCWLDSVCLCSDIFAQYFSNSLDFMTRRN